MQRWFLAGIGVFLFTLCLGESGSANRVDDAIAQFQQITDTTVRDWKIIVSDVPGAEKPDFDDSAWKVVSPEYDWSLKPTAWLRKTIIIPEKVGPMPVAGSRVILRMGLDDIGECYVDGVFRQRFDWDQCHVVLTESARPGEKFVVAVKGINTGGPGRLLSASLEYSVIESIKGMGEQILGELWSANRLVNKESDKSKQLSYRKLLDTAVNVIDTKALEQGDKAAFGDSLEAVRKHLEPLRALVKDDIIHLVGHAHIDMNWLWLWPETVDVCKNTFSTVIKLMDEYPEFRFSQSQASTYLAMEEYYPDLFAEIQRRVKSGRWEITGGTWTEGDMNMASGESIVRQILYAKRYFKEKFGVEPEICWEPDTFGHAWTVPQILVKSGLKYYYFCRCGKDQPVFWWEGPDGSRVLAYNRGGYNGSIGDHIMDYSLDQKNRYGAKDSMYVYGVGDHGGGPTRQDLNKAVQLQGRTVFPKVKFSTVIGFFKSLLAQKRDFPVIRDELNFTFQGCYTTHSDIKKMNRVSENLIPTAEMFSTLAEEYGFIYPKKGFVKAWRNMCFNQFHDIFDGSAIHDSYKYSKRLFDEIYGIADDSLRRSTSLIARSIDTRGEGIPVVVFNPLSWKRTDVARARIPDECGKTASVRDASGREMPCQVVGDEIVFTAQDVPSIGYKVFYLSEKPSTMASTVSTTNASIENEFFKVQVDPASGAVMSVYDKKAGREVIASGQKGDQLQLLFEQPHGMSAWDIGPISKTENLESAVSVEPVSGASAGVLRVKHVYGKSAFSQDIILYAGVPRIDFKMTADWYEQGTREIDAPMLKVAFPVDVKDGKATFEIPFGSIERPANGAEVPAQKWIDLSGKDYGVSLLNDCKYGHDVNGNVMRLTLLRSSYNPDPTPDQGRHEITYSLYPHSGDWRKSDTVKRGYELNNPLIASIENSHTGRLPKEHSFVMVEQSNVIVTALKKSEDGDDMIIRFYESQGKEGTATIKLNTGAKAVRETDLAERPLVKRGIPVIANCFRIPIGKWEIKTIRTSDRKLQDRKILLRRHLWKISVPRG